MEKLKTKLIIYFIFTFVVFNVCSFASIYIENLIATQQMYSQNGIIDLMTLIDKIKNNIVVYYIIFTLIIFYKDIKNFIKSKKGDE